MLSADEYINKTKYGGWVHVWLGSERIVDSGNEVCEGDPLSLSTPCITA